MPRWFYVLAKKTRPISFVAGHDRGTPVDRYFIERFINANSDRIRGAVLEVKDRGYTIRVGGSRVTRSDVVDVNRENKEANIISDIRDLKEIADNTYDCFIITQVLQYVDDLDAADPRIPPRPQAWRMPAGDRSHAGKTGWPGRPRRRPLLAHHARLRPLSFRETFPRGATGNRRLGQRA